MRTLTGEDRDRGGTTWPRGLRGAHGPRDGVRGPAADDAIAELYVADWTALVRLGWLLGCEERTAEEIVQEALIAVHRRWDSLRTRERATRYLRRAVVNGARSRLPRLGVEARTPDAEASNSIVMALGRLPEPQKEVLAMRYYLGLSDAEIADALGISAASVQAHGHRGVIAMHGQMEAAS